MSLKRHFEYDIHVMCTFCEEVITMTSDECALGPSVTTVEKDLERELIQHGWREGTPKNGDYKIIVGTSDNKQVFGWDGKPLLACGKCASVKLEQQEKEDNANT